MKNDVYRKLFNLELLRDAIILYLYYRFENGFDVLKEIKILKFTGDLDKLQEKFCLHRQPQAKNMKRNKEIKQNWIGTEKNDFNFCVILTTITKVLFPNHKSLGYS